MWWQRHTSHLRLKLQNTNANSFNLFFNLCSLFFSFSSHFTLFTSVHVNSLYFEALQRSMHSEGRKPGSLKRKALQFPEEQQKRPAKFAQRFAWRHLRVHLPATDSETITQLSPDYHPSWRSERGQLGWTGIRSINTDNSEAHPLKNRPRPFLIQFGSCCHQFCCRIIACIAGGQRVVSILSILSACNHLRVVQVWFQHNHK